MASGAIHVRIIATRARAADFFIPMNKRGFRILEALQQKETEVAAWWSSLDVTERQRLTREAAERFAAYQEHEEWGY